MKVRAGVLRSIAYDQLRAITDNRMEDPGDVTEDTHDEAAAAIELIRAVDEGAKRIVIDLTR